MTVHLPGKLLLFITALTGLFTITACKKDVGVDVPAMTAEGKAGSTLSVIPLKVTIHDLNSSNELSRIREDGKGVYQNGTDYVEAVLDQYGTFAFNTFKTSTKNAVAVRHVIYDFNDPVDPDNTYRPSPSNSKNYHFSTGGSQYGTNPFIALQNLGVNGNAASECIYMGNGIANSTKSWRVSFRKGYENTATSPTAFAMVTRTKVKLNGDNSDEWVIQPVGACSPNSNVAALRSGSGTRRDPEVLHGYYKLPFLFTLTAMN